MVHGETVVVPPDPLPLSPPKIPHVLAWFELGYPR